jgi:hypothetical protein
MRHPLASLTAFASALFAVFFLLPGLAEPTKKLLAKPLKGAAGTNLSGVGKANLDFSKPYGYHLQPILAKINANSTQRVKISQIVGSYRSSIQPLRDEYKEKQQDFIGSMMAGNTAESIMSKQVELGHLSSEITAKYCLMKLEIRRQLDPDQIRLFEDYGREHGWNH